MISYIFTLYFKVLNLLRIGVDLVRGTFLFNHVLEYGILNQ
jgi:hypothetical protein